MTQVNFAALINASALNASAKNKQRMSQVALLASDAKVTEMLTKLSVDVKRFDDRAIYATEKVVKIIHNVTRDALSYADINDNMLATIKTVVLMLDNKQTSVTFNQLRAAISADVKLNDTEAQYVVRRRSILSVATLAAQSQQCRDALITLNVAKQSARETLTLTENAFTRAARKALKDISL